MVTMRLSTVYHGWRVGDWMDASIMGLQIVHIQRTGKGKFRVYLMMDVDTGVQRRTWIESIDYDNIKVTIEPDIDE